MKLTLLILALVFTMPTHPPLGKFTMPTHPPVVAILMPTHP